MEVEALPLEEEVPPAKILCSDGSTTVFSSDTVGKKKALSILSPLAACL